LHSRSGSILLFSGWKWRPSSKVIPVYAPEDHCFNGIQDLSAAEKTCKLKLKGECNGRPSVKDQEGGEYWWRRKLLSACTVAYFFFLGFLTCLGLPISPPPKLQSEKGLSKICNHLADKNLVLNHDRF